MAIMRAHSDQESRGLRTRAARRAISRSGLLACSSLRDRLALSSRLWSSSPEPSLELNLGVRLDCPRADLSMVSGRRVWKIGLRTAHPGRRSQEGRSQERDVVTAPQRALHWMSAGRKYEPCTIKTAVGG